MHPTTSAPRPNPAPRDPRRGPPQENVTVSDVAVTRKIDLSFTVRVNRVLLEVAVRGQARPACPRPDARDLMVLEGGQPRGRFWSSPGGDPPLSIARAACWITSGSMQEAIGSAREAAGGFVTARRRGPGDGARLPPDKV